MSDFVTQGNSPLSTHSDPQSNAANPLEVRWPPNMDRPRRKEAEERVYTNELDALEALIVAGLPPDEMQAAAWTLVQRVRGLVSDLAKVEKARGEWTQQATRAKTDGFADGLRWVLERFNLDFEDELALQEAIEKGPWE